MKTHKADQETDRWLRQNGICVKNFAKTDVLLLKAQKNAYELLHKYPSFIDEKERGKLRAFLKAMSHQSKRASVTITQAYRILNLSSKARRQLFGQQRNFK